LFPPGWRLDPDNQWRMKSGLDPAAVKQPNEQGGDANNWYTEIFFLEMINILTEADPAKLHFRFLPEGDEGLWSPYPGSDRHFGQEGTVVGLSGNQLLCVLRTRLGYPCYSVSGDYGATWTNPEALRLCPDGALFDQPCASCPMTKLPDGRLVFLFHNVKPEGSGWYPRDPLWISVGREAPGACAKNAGLYFSKPKVLIYNDGRPEGPFNNWEIAYPAFYAIKGRHYVAYANKTCEIRVSEVSENLLDDFGLPSV